MRDLTYAENWISKIWNNSMIQCACAIWHTLGMLNPKIWYNSMIQCACAIWDTLGMWIPKICYNYMIQCACTIWHTLRCEFRKSDINLWFNAHARSDIRWDVNFENLILFYNSMRMRDLTYAKMWILKIWYDTMRMRDLTYAENWISKIWYNSMIQCACAIWHTLRCEFRKSDINLWLNAHAWSDIRWDVNFENLI